MATTTDELTESGHTAVADAFEDAVATAEPELPGMPPSTRPRFEGQPIHVLEIAFKGTIELGTSPADVELFKRYQLGDPFTLIVHGEVSGRPISRKRDKDGIPVNTSRATLTVETFETPGGDA